MKDLKYLRSIKTLLLLLFFVSYLLFCSHSNNYKIGAILPLTGEAAKYGIDLQRGYDLAVEEINSKGGISGKTIKIIYEDCEAKPNNAVLAAKKLIEKDKVKIILGCFTSSSTLAVAPICESKKVILFSSSSSSPQITYAGDYIFRNEISDLYGAEESAKMFFKIGYKNIGILYVNNDFGIDYANVVKNTYTKLGGEIAITSAFDQNAIDFRTQLIKINQKNIDALLLICYKEAILILRQMAELGIKKQILSTALFEDSEIIEKCGDLAEGAIYTYYGVFSSQIEDTLRQDFLTKFKNKYNALPEYYAPLAYDAVNIIKLALESSNFEIEKIKTNLYSIKDYNGLSGITTIDENGDVIKPVILKKVQNGKFVNYNLLM